MSTDRIISHIVAVSENGIIGKDGGLPWRLPDDFRYFKDTTWAMPVIMGRKTFESMKKPLPGRINIVVTAKSDYHAENTYVTKSLEGAIDQARDADTTEIFIIGGGRIFMETMDWIHRIYLTRVHAVIDGDTHYPEIDKTAFEKISEVDHPADDKHPYHFSFEVWERK